MDESQLNDLYAVLGKLYYELTKFNKIVMQQNQNAAGQNQKIQELAEANKQLSAEIKKCRECPDCTCKVNNGPEA